MKKIFILTLFYMACSDDLKSFNPVAGDDGGADGSSDSGDTCCDTDSNTSTGDVDAGEDTDSASDSDSETETANVDAGEDTDSASDSDSEEDAGQDGGSPCPWECKNLDVADALTVCDSDTETPDIVRNYHFTCDEPSQACCQPLSAQGPGTIHDYCADQGLRCIVGMNCASSTPDFYCLTSITVCCDQQK